MYNLPCELASNDLMEIFEEFGPIVSTYLKPAAENKPKVGFVTFEQVSSAKKAIKEADGKFMGVNPIYVK